MPTQDDSDQAQPSTFIPLIIGWDEDALSAACSAAGADTTPRQTTDAEDLARWQTVVPPEPSLPKLKLSLLFLKFLSVSILCILCLTVVLHLLLPAVPFRMVSMGACLGWIYALVLVFMYRILND